MVQYSLLMGIALVLFITKVRVLVLDLGNVSRFMSRNLVGVLETYVNPPSRLCHDKHFPTNYEVFFYSDLKVTQRSIQVADSTT